jgi:hypothetical protein
MEARRFCLGWFVEENETAALIQNRVPGHIALVD